MATLKEIAEKTGVSTATVSYVMNGTKKMPPETVEKVLKAVEEANYCPDILARMLVTGASKIVYIIITDVMDSFFSAIIRGAENVLTKAGYSLIIGSSNENVFQLENHLRTALGFKVAGLIISPPGSLNKLKIPIGTYNIPIVQVNRRNKIIRSDIVITDNARAVYEVTKNLISLNHRRMSIITGPRSLSTYSERTEGFRKALREHDLLELNRDLLLAGKDSRSETGYNLFAKAFFRPDPPTAIIGGGSAISQGIYQAIIDNGIRVPDDLSFIGYDISTWSFLIRPSLSEISQKSYDMGRIAAELLLEKFKEKETACKVIRLPARIIAGDSIKKIKRPEGVFYESVN